MTIAPGTKLGRYEIRSKLGEGGMGEVYLAEDTQLGRRVAIKLLSPDAVSDENAKKRLVREARAAAALDHPNICSIYEVGEADGLSFIAMQYVEGETLDARIQSKPLELKESLAIAAQVADALAEAHAHGIIHRDIKPANIIITPRGQSKVMDFGLARMIGGATDREAETQSMLTAQGAILGTVPYMSPEQVRGEKLDARSDIFSFGVVLYEMISGRQPFANDSAAATASAILSREPPPLARYSMNVPDELQRIVRKCLEKDRERRYQTIRDGAIDLENCRREGEAARDSASRSRQIAEGVAVTTTASAARGGKAFLSRRELMIAGLLVLVVAAALAYVLVFRRANTTARPPEIKSLAVLPLENLSGDPQQEYFADGMTEELITDLGQLTGLKRVIARGSVMQYKGTKKPPSEIARELKVDALITGAVVRSGDRVRITVQLINPETEAQLWSERYERDVRDILSLQNELTRAIAGEIRLKLAPEEQTRLATARTVNPEAYDAYLQGRFHWQKITAADFDAAEHYFQLAIEKDPNYALAYTGLAIVWAQRCMQGLAPCGEMLPKWREAVRKAVELDPNLPEAQASAAAVTFYGDWNWMAGGEQLRRAVARQPNYSEAHLWYAYWLFCMGRSEEGVAETRRALELDPYSSFLKWYVGDALYKARHYDEAIAYLQQLLREDPSVRRAKGTLQLVFEAKGMDAEAWAEWQQIVADNGDAEVAATIQRGYAQGGYRNAMGLRAELAVQRRRRQYVLPSQIAGFYAAAGDQERAIDWLEKAVEEHEPAIVGLKPGPRWDVLRGHPRFKALLQKMNLTP